MSVSWVICPSQWQNDWIWSNHSRFHHPQVALPKDPETLRIPKALTLRHDVQHIPGQREKQWTRGRPGCLAKCGAHEYSLICLANSNYPLVICYVAIEHGPVEIVSFPIKNGGSFHSYVNVYQRVPPNLLQYIWNFDWLHHSYSVISTCNFLSPWGRGQENTLIKLPVMCNSWLVVYQPIWKIWKSVGMMKFPIYGKLKHVPNHQPAVKWTMSSIQWHAMYVIPSMPLLLAHAGHFCIQTYYCVTQWSVRFCLKQKSKGGATADKKKQSNMI